MAEIHVEYGKHNVRVEKENYIEMKLPLEINEQVNNYKIKLEPNPKQNSFRYKKTGTNPVFLLFLIYKKCFAWNQIVFC